MTPWTSRDQIAVGPIGPEERRLIDASMRRFIAQHRNPPKPPRRLRPMSFLFGERVKPGRCSTVATARPAPPKPAPLPKPKRVMSPAQAASLLKAQAASRAKLAVIKETARDQVETRFDDWVAKVDEERSTAAIPAPASSVMASAALDSVACG